MKNYKKIEELLRPIYKHQYTNRVYPYNDQNHASPDTIIFHSGHEKYAFLSNFYPCSVVDEGIQFSHVEGAFQAAKVDDPEERKRFINVTPQAAKKMGGARGKYRMNHERLKRWISGEGNGEEYGERVEVMRRLIQEKFRHPCLRQALLDTGEAQLVERLPRFPDSFWGTKKDGSGQNMLGRLLMEERKRLSMIM